MIATLIKTIEIESKFRFIINCIDLGVKLAMINKKIISTIIRIIITLIISTSNSFSKWYRNSQTFNSKNSYSNYYYDVSICSHSLILGI